VSADVEKHLEVVESTKHKDDQKLNWSALSVAGMCVEKL